MLLNVDLFRLTSLGRDSSDACLQLSLGIALKVCT